ncbi:hypothetical protein BS50DRAFT_374496 [Corynespora cassiicola Philippines]|uniref:Uncharacterized protein n=1 Tax=Corynespora cassiicola Philippines TaxID=1448308 RepID=A0A2T2NN49_CORCC|nr:hypothetical protein BS50DRAFT_374496 [Corynespora cassiicola Philippines]
MMYSLVCRCLQSAWSACRPLSQLRTGAGWLARRRTDAIASSTPPHAETRVASCSRRSHRFVAGGRRCRGFNKREAKKKRRPSGPGNQ